MITKKAVSFRNGNINDLRDKLAELLKDTGLVASYKVQAQDYVCERYDWDEVTEMTVDLYCKGRKNGVAG